MAAPVIVKFQVEGVAQVQNAFRTVEQACIQAEVGKSRAASKGSADRTKSADREAAEQIGIWKRTDKVIDQIQKNSVKETEKAAKAKTFAEEQSAKEKIAAWKRGDAISSQIIANSVKETERAAKAKTAAEERAARDRVAAWKRSDAASAQIIAKAARDTDVAEKAKTASVTRETRRRGEEEDSARRRFANVIGGAAATGLGRGVRQAGRIASSAVQGVLSLGGGFSLADSVKDRMTVDRMAVIASNAAYDPTAAYDPSLSAARQRNKRQNPQELAKKARAVAIATGIDATELVEGTTSYIDKASDWAGGVDNMETMARIAKSTGSKFSDVSSALGMLKAQNPGMDVKQGKQLLYNIAAQSVRGSVNFSDVAKNAAGLGKNSFNMAGDQFQLQSQMIGLSQLGVKTAGKAAPTTTEISSFFSSIRKHAKNAGLKTDSQGNIDNGDTAEVIGQVFRQARGNKNIMQASEKSGGMGITAYGIKLPMAMDNFYRAGKEALAKANPKASADQLNEAGVQSVIKNVRATASVQGNKDTVDENFSSVMATDGEKLDQVLRQLRDATADALIPALRDLIPVIKDLVPYFVDLVKFLGSHPWVGLGGVIAANIAASIGRAAIGEGIKAILMNLLSGKPALGGASGGTGGTSRGGVLGAVGLGAVLGTGVAAFIKEGGERGADGDMKAENLTAQVAAWKRGVRGENEVSPEAARKRVEEAQGRLDNQGFGDWFMGHGKVGAVLGGEDSRKEYAQYTADKALVDNAKLRQGIEDAVIGGMSDALTSHPLTPVRSTGALLAPK